MKLFFALDSAMLDASIAAWQAKYFYDFARPITAVRAFDWLPYQPANVVTQPFPEYVSGHSTFSAAGAHVLRSFIGSDGFGASVIIRAGTSFVEPRTPVHPGVPATDISLSWPTFTAAADEAGVSRRFGGIHFADGDHAGRKMGEAIGQQAMGAARGYWRGRQGSNNCPDCPVHPVPSGPVQVSGAWHSRS